MKTITKIRNIYLASQQTWRVLKNQMASDRSRWREADGDVPGWVMVTLMTAGLVVALSAVALPALTALFNNAITSVSGM